jgi:hypothetical protein
VEEAELAGAALGPGASATGLSTQSITWTTATSGRHQARQVSSLHDYTRLANYTSIASRLTSVASHNVGLDHRALLPCSVHDLDAVGTLLHGQGCAAEGVHEGVSSGQVLGEVHFGQDVVQLQYKRQSSTLADSVAS